MDRYEKSLREKRSHQNSHKNPSFSSTLLDAIYRSIDDEGVDHHDDQRLDEEEAEQLILYRETTRKKQSRDHACLQKHEEIRSCRIQKWMDKKTKDEPTIRRSDFEDGFLKLSRDHASMIFHSTSSSSESSCGGFSSSETESVYGRRPSSAYTPQRPKPIRTGQERPDKSHPSNQNKTQFSDFYVSSSSASKDRNLFEKPKQDGFIKSKSRAASKIYGELKKARQPISPGGRLASFLNSIFTAGHAKKAKIQSSSIDGHDLSFERKSKSAQASTCSSASSFSRSCLSKTPSSRGGKSINGVKRTVRFFPVSVIVDEDCRPCGEKRLYEGDPNLTALNAIRKIGESAIGSDLKFHLMEKNKRVEEAAKEMLKEYQKKRELFGEVIRAVHQDHQTDGGDDNDDDDDAASYSSSDLFELENLTAIGIERYREELPVYETTHLDTNRAIANGLIL
ncbi:protein BIG GRAIN 1-like B [Magnolia sinica]|uniref:protein BIG GRAIN 1-like B n=1 Tax=Magnolia sinica TaxID=86752 RepID=UPI0026585316|nr:protein BIG GRAIN 1-like B [Magnolia sinica]